MTVFLKPVHDNFIFPIKATEQSAGMDLHACLDCDVVISPFDRVLIPTGFCIELEPDSEAQIRPRSGLALKHGITVLNSPGTIDSDFRGEVKVMLINFGKTDFVIKNGMRVAQMVISRVESFSIEISEELADTDRGAGGFGSTGR